MPINQKLIIEPNYWEIFKNSFNNLHELNPSDRFLKLFEK